MLHRIVSRSVVVLAATAFLASCEDNTTGTPLTPPPPSTAVYVTPIEPEGGYGIKDTVINILGVDTTVTIVTPNVEFEVLYPDGSVGVDQVITFNVNLPGLVQATKDTVPASGIVTPGYWIVARPCNVPDFCRSPQRVIATPVSGNTGYIDVSTVPPAPPEDLRASR
jgi:hypothetical protein